MLTLKTDGLNFCVLLLGLRNDFYLQAFFKSCFSKCAQFTGRYQKSSILTETSATETYKISFQNKSKTTGCASTNAVR